MANNFNRISKVTPTGTVSTFANNLSTPQGLAFDPSGNLFAADAGNNKVVAFNSSGTIIRTIASRANLAFNNPRNIAFGSFENSIYFTSSNSSKILFFSDTTPEGRDLNLTLKNNISAPFGIAIDLLGGLEKEFSLGREIFTVVDAGYVTNLGGDPKTINSATSSSKTVTSFDRGGLNFANPLGLVFDPISKNLYISDADNNTITALNPQTGDSSVLVSRGLNRPSFLAISGDSLYISDNGSGNILRQELRTTPIPFEFNPTLGLVAIGVFVIGKKLIKRK